MYRADDFRLAGSFSIFSRSLRMFTDTVFSSTNLPAVPQLRQDLLLTQHLPFISMR